MFRLDNDTILLCPAFRKQSLASMNVVTGEFTAMSFVARETMTKVFHQALLNLDASLNIHHRLSDHRKQKKADLKAEYERAKSRHAQEEKDRNLAFLAQFQVGAGEMFSLREFDYEGDQVSIFIAERDLTAADFPRILKRDMDGLVRNAGLREFFIDVHTPRALQVCLNSVNEDADEFSGPS